MTPQDAPAGPVLGKTERAALSDALIQGVPGLYSEWDDGEDVGKVLAAIGPVVATLVSQARAEGAAEERERSRRFLDAVGYRVNRGPLHTEPEP